MATIAIIDGSNLIFRAYFAVAPLSTSGGVPTNAVYGGLKSFKSVIHTLKPCYVLVCWDSGKKSFRNQLDPNYKAQRPPISNDLKTQFALLQEAFTHLRVPQITAPDGMECDDVIGTIATKASEIGMDSVIVSSDKDFYQLCNNYIKVWSFTVAKKTGNGLIDIDYVRREFGVEPNQLNCIKSLTGEKSDNIQGVRGIGPKTATSLIRQHGTIYNLLDHLQANPTHKNYTIYENRPTVALALELAKIRTNIEVKEVPIYPVDTIDSDGEKLRAFFKNLEMQSFLDEFPAWRHLFSYKTTV
jgi:DNA polymerase-1